MQYLENSFFYRIFSQITLFIFYFVLTNFVDCCNFENYENSLLKTTSQFQELEQTIPENVVDNQQYGFSFWSFSIPLLQTQSQSLEEEFQVNELEVGELLFIIKNQDHLIAVGRKQYNYLTQTVSHIISVQQNQQNNIEKTFSYSALEYEGIWILHVITISPYTQTINFQLSNLSREEISYTDQLASIIIDLGGKAYIQNHNLNVFRGRLSKIITIQQNIGLDQIFQDILQNCQIPKPEEGEQVVNIVSGLSLYEDQQISLYEIHQFGNKYCLQGWVKYKVNLQQEIVKYLLLRFSGFYIYQNEQTLGDELFKLEVEFVNQNPEQTSITITVDSYGMPVVQTFKEQNELFQISELNQIYSQVILQNLQNINYYQGLQEWHFLKYEYGRVDNTKMLFQIHFSNELGQIDTYLGNQVFANSFINSNFYLFLGGDSFNDNYLQASIYNLQFVFNYDEQKNFVINCHYSCETCDGPLNNNCLTCSDLENRYYIEERKICECKLGYLEINDQTCKNFPYLFPSIKETEELISLICPFGYFRIQKEDGSIACAQCPQKSRNALMCSDCLFYPNTWYLKPVCKNDLVKVYQQSETEAYTQIQRIEQDYNVYLIDNNYKLHYHEELQDFCDNSFYDDYCRLQTHLLHLGTQPTAYCKRKWFYFDLDIDNSGFCRKGSQTCEIYSYMDQCQTCLFGFYFTEYGDCMVCPSQCFTCEFSYDIYDVVCDSCPEQTTLVEGNCISCGQYCQVCENHFDQLSDEYVLACLQCFNEFDYYLSLDGVNCKLNRIENCLYVFEAQENNFLINSLDQYIFIKENVEKVNTYCAKCKDDFNIYMMQNQECIKSEEIPCIFGIGEYDQDQKLDLVVCLKSEQNQIGVQEFTENCSQYKNNCQICLMTITSNYYDCLECNQGYYATREEGICKICPSQLNCLECYQEDVLRLDFWKQNTKAFYRQYIETNQFHRFTENAQSQNQSEYLIFCKSCQSGYKLYNSQCIKYCQSDCLNCILYQGQYICVECYKQYYGTMLSTENYSCISCPEPCSLCRSRTREEISEINPLFSNLNYLQYSRQCLKNFENENFYYDDVLQQYIDCGNINSNCEKKISIELNLFCQQDSYAAGLNMLQDEYSKKLYRQQNVLLLSLFNNQSSFAEFENDNFYKLANQKGVKTISIKITSQSDQECLIFYDRIQQRFSENIFSVINVELEFSFTKKMVFQPYSGMKFINFSKVKISGLTFVLSQRKIASNTISYQSLFSQTIFMNQITIAQKYQGLSYSAKIIFNNIDKVYIDNMIFQDLQIDQTDNLFAIQSTQQIKLIKFSNFKFINSIFYNGAIFNIEVGNKDQIIFSNFYLNSSFENIKFMQTFPAQENGQFMLNTFNLQSTITNSQSFIDLSYIQYLTINDFQCKESQIRNSTIIIINHNLLVSNLYVQSSQFYQKSQFLLNKNALITSINYQFEAIVLTQNQYDSQLHLLFLQKYSSSYSKLLLNDLTVTNNVQLDESLAYNEEEKDSALIYLQLDQIQITNFIIEKGPGLFEISISAVEEVLISKGQIIQTQYSFLGLHQYLSCQLNQGQSYKFPSTIIINQARNIQLNEIDVSQIILYDFPIISYKSAGLNEIQQNETINISNLKFSQNTLLLTQAQKQIALIQFISSQNTVIQFQNMNFTNNLLQEYNQNNEVVSAGLLQFICPYCTISIQDSYFSKNLVLNSTDNLLYISCYMFTLINTVFEENSIFNYEIIKSRLLWGYQKDDKVFLEDIQSSFPINSRSGCGLIIAQQLNISNVSFNTIEGQVGSCFEILPQENSIMQFQNCYFNNISTRFDSQMEYGSVFAIDSTNSQSLKLYFNNMSASDVYCRGKGGFIYLVSGLGFHYVEFNNMSFENIYAAQGSIIYAEFAKLNTAKQLLLINKLHIQNSLSKYLYYLNQFPNSLSEQEYSLLSNNRTLFYTDYSTKVQLENIKAENLYSESFLQSFNIQKTFLISITISNSFVSNGLISLLPKQFSTTNLQFNNIQIKSVEVGFVLSNYSCIDNKVTYNTQKPYCLHDILQVPKTLNNYFDHNFEQNSYCLLKQLNERLLIHESGLIKIPTLSEFDQISATLINFQKINCQVCKYGLFHISFLLSNVAKSLLSQQLSHIYIQNSTCGQQSCLQAIKNFDQSSRLLLSEDITDTKFEINIRYYYCFSNLATYGTCFYVQSLKMLLKNSYLALNNATQYGGAMYVKDTYEIVLENTTIENNYAEIGGGIYLENQIAQNFNRLGNKIEKNSAKIYGQNIIGVPESLSIKLSQDTQFLEKNNIISNNTELIQQIEVQRYRLINGNEVDMIYLPSGQEIQKYQYFDWKLEKFYSANLIFRILALSQAEEEMKNLDSSFCLIASRKLDLLQEEEFQHFTNNYTNYVNVSFNAISLDYNLDNLIISFDNSLPSNIVLQLEFSCSSISVPIFNLDYPYNIINTHQNYKLRVNIKTFSCQFGEIKKVTDNTCQTCDSSLGLFTFKLNQEKCQLKDDLTTIKVQNNQLQLRSGYWRPYFDISKIEYCYNLIYNCLGGWQYGDNSCYLGHIGALCEQCDIYNLRGDGSFSTNSKFSCGGCIERNQNILIIIGTIFCSLILFYVSVQGNIKTIEENSKLRIIEKSSTGHILKAKASILIKILTNYLQIISTITTFRLSFPRDLSNTVSAVGSPVQTLTYSLSCFLIYIFDFQILYSSMIWELMMPFMFINSFLPLFLIASQFKIVSYNSSVITCTVIYSYIYFQPNLIGGLVALISYREISGFKWIQANVAYRYDTSLHYSWILKMCLPALIIIAFVIPILFTYGLYQNRYVLDKKITRLHWGFLYQEYKNNAYFWEMIKILQKELMILFLTYYEDNIVVKGMLVLLVTYLYQELNKYYQPYCLNSLNNLDYYTVNVCMISISLGAGAYISQQNGIEEIELIFFILIICFNVIMLINLLFQITKEQFKQIDVQLDPIRDILRVKFPHLESHRWLGPVLRNRQAQIRKVKKQFLSLKKKIIPIARDVLALKTQKIENNQVRLPYTSISVFGQYKQSLSRIASSVELNL